MKGLLNDNNKTAKYTYFATCTLYSVRLEQLCLLKIVLCTSKIIIMCLVGLVLWKMRFKSSAIISNILRYIGIWENPFLKPYLCGKATPFVTQFLPPFLAALDLHLTQIEFSQEQYIIDNDCF